MKHDRPTIPGLPPTSAGSRVPVLVRSRPIALDSVEGAILPWIDGETEVEWIAHKTALSVAEVTAAIRCLERLGVARFADVVQIDELDLVEDTTERETRPNPAFDRPTLPGSPQTFRYGRW